MNGKGGGGHNNGGGKASPMTTIPPSTRKIIQSLKEIVTNFPDHEIYATLRDCNMDPNEAVSRLLSQDHFHEVKSKREKKKENKEPTDSRSRGSGINNPTIRGSGVNNPTIRGSGRGGVDRHGGRGGTNHFSSSDSALPGKPVYKKVYGTPSNGGFASSASSVLGNNVNRRPPPYSDFGATENTSTVSNRDGLSSSSQYGGLQSPWTGNVVGQVSMADIVKRGRPQAQSSMHNSSFHSSNHQNGLIPSAASDHNLHLLQGHASKFSETNTDQGPAISHSVPHIDGWPCIENQHNVREYNVVDVHANSEYYANSSSFSEAYWQPNIHLGEHVAEDSFVENANDVRSASISAKSSSEDNAGAENAVASVAANLEQLNLQREDQGTKPEADDSLIIPSHLQLHTPECLNLSFGCFGSQNNASATELSDARNLDYYGDEHLTTTSNGNLAHGTGASAGTDEHSSISLQEIFKFGPPNIARENQYLFPSSSQGFTYENAQQDITIPHSQTSLQMQNLAPFSSVMQAYPNYLPGAQLASTVQTGREDIQYSPFPATQSMPGKHSNIASSINGPTITMSEALRASSISMPQPNPQTLPGANVATGPTLSQHLAMHPYSQSSLPLGHLANMIGYPLGPQSYTYMPSAFQQGFAGNSTYHQSLAAMLPQYKNNVSVSSLPQSAVPPGYGFNSSTSIPGGNFSLNPAAAASGTTSGYDNVISSQFKDNNHMMSPQQNENSPTWVQGPGSRSMSAVPPNMYYSLQGQNQQPGGFRQRQQSTPTQHFGSLGYPDFYQSKTGISLEHQHQNPSEASLGGLQSQPSKQLQQLWQSNY